MICKKCGAKLRDNCIYCSKCGTEARIVPDYSFEDDYVVNLEKEDKPKEVTEIPQQGRKEKACSKKKKKWIRLFILVIVIICCVILFTVILLQSKYQKSYDWHYSQGYEAYEKADYDAAVEHFEACIELDESQALPYVYLGKIAFKSDDIQEAISYYEKAIEADSDCEKAYKALKSYYSDNEDYNAINKLMEDASDTIISKVFSEYTIDAPVANPTSGTYENLIIEFEESDYEIYYTLNGKSPKTSGKKYSDPIVMDEEGTYTLTAVSKDSRGIFSKEVSFEYQVSYNVPDMPQVSPDGGTFESPATITITVPSGCSAYYSWKQSVPDENSTKYTKPIQVPEGNNILSVVIISDNGISSGIFRGNYVYLPDVLEEE
ncbi:chitobiase/beta-hexosaminidase C-terminal domain-containing protein [Eubacterium oxidoreducens]|uniref:TPR repeat-containing protein n=1 Tax=Eubacterium oxidoreducens TaxID=1732 RepID=A0A1G6AL37_EUBOX|nr:chitobiase/beta-hexosaminidase C-terminal domain-containing protein [Eubacterium oxidoreducens]SDB09106.1 TPR repeat-containing protein [Eubacterium oxidoreducens]